MIVDRVLSGFESADAHLVNLPNYHHVGSNKIELLLLCDF